MVIVDEYFVFIYIYMIVMDFCVVYKAVCVKCFILVFFYQSPFD